jgi:hypothetical protein
MFQELTDEDHPMDTFEIIDYLAEHGVPANIGLKFEQSIIFEQVLRKQFVMR